MGMGGGAAGYLVGGSTGDYFDGTETFTSDYIVHGSNLMVI